MTDKAISPLRQRMIEDMSICNFTAKTPNDNICHVKSFSVFFGRSPDRATSEDIRRDEHAARTLDEIGCLIGGQQKAQTAHPV